MVHGTQEPVGPIPRLAVRALALLARCMHACATVGTSTRAGQDSMLAYLAADAQSLQHLLFPLQSPHATPYPVAMRVAVLEFAISVMDTQPAVAGLLLNTAAPKKARRAVRFAGGEEEAKDKAGADGGAAASSSSAGEAGKTKATGGFHRPSVVLEVLDVLETAEHHLDHNPRLLSVALHLLLGIFREGTMPLSRVCGCGCGCVAARASLCCSHACLPSSHRPVVALWLHHGWSRRQGRSTHAHLPYAAAP